MSFKLRILYTGGTIGSVDQPLAPLSGRDFCKAFTTLVEPTILERFPGASVSHDWLEPTLDSTNLQPSDWCEIARRIIGAPGDASLHADHDAFLILHGTDTMAWSAAALSFLLTGLDRTGHASALLSKPVVLTGSQLPLFSRSSPDAPLAINYNTDALRNVLGAVEMLRGGFPAVGLFFEDKLMLGNRALKTEASRFPAFTTPNHPVLGEVGLEASVANAHVPPLPYLSELALDNPRPLAALQSQLEHVTASIDKADVLVLPAFPARCAAASGEAGNLVADVLDAALSTGDGRVRGVFLEGYGGGNFPSGSPSDAERGAIYKVLKRAHEAGTVIVAGTQVTSGTVNSTTYAAGSWLAAAGAIGTYDMTAPATHAKLLILLALADHNDNNWTQADIERLMRTPLAGEMMGVNRLGSRGRGCLLSGQSIAALDGSATLVNDPDAGPVLADDKGNALWTPLQGKPRMPVRLVMQDDGNLVILDRTNARVWSAHEVPERAGYSELILSGSARDGSLALYVRDLCSRRVTAALFGTPPQGE
jgi:L-asparaginase